MTFTQALNTGVLKRAVRITKYTVSFGKPYGAYDYDEACLATNPFAFFTLTSDTTNYGTAAYELQTPMTHSVVNPVYTGTSMTGLDRKVVKAVGSFGLGGSYQLTYGEGLPKSITIAVLADPSYDAAIAGEGYLVAGILNSSGGVEFGLVLYSEGRVGAVINNTVVDNMIFNGDGLLALTYSAHDSTVTLMSGGSTKKKTGVSPTLCPAPGLSGEIFVGGAVQGSAVSGKVIDGSFFAPFRGRLEGAGFWAGALSDRVLRKFHLLKTLQTYDMPLLEVDSSPVG